MKKIVLSILLISLIGICGLNAQTYKLTFWANGSSGLASANGGHAWFELEGFGKWGFFPKEFVKGYESTDDDGVIIDESFHANGTTSWTTKISSEQRKKIISVFKSWKSGSLTDGIFVGGNGKSNYSISYYDSYNNHRVGTNDCVSFCMRIAEAIDLDFHHTFTQSPKAFVESLKHNN